MSFLKHAYWAVLFTSVMSPGFAFAQSEERTVIASVLDRSGAPVTALTASDFIVREDGVEREVLTAAPATDALRVAVLVDTSQAIDRHVGDVRQALKTFFRRLAGEHEVALITFGDRPTVLVDYTRDLDRLESGADRVFAHSGSGSYLLDAIIEASKGLRRREGTRSAIVVITAEGPEFSERTHQSVVDELRTSDASLHAFVLDTRRAAVRSRAGLDREIALSDGARMTGGRREHLLSSMSLAPALSRLAALLEEQYAIVYSRPSSLVSASRLEVSLRRKDLIVLGSRKPGRASSVTRNN
jgi:Ca-activated chloride channel homolog